MLLHNWNRLITSINVVIKVLGLWLHQIHLLFSKFKQHSVVRWKLYIVYMHIPIDWIIMYTRTFKLQCDEYVLYHRCRENLYKKLFCMAYESIGDIKKNHFEQWKIIPTQESSILMVLFSLIQCLIFTFTFETESNLQSLQAIWIKKKLNS